MNRRSPEPTRTLAQILAAGAAILASALAGCGGAVDPGAAPEGAEIQPQAYVQREALFAPAVASGTLTVTLRPTEIVSPGQPTPGTFGVPFPQGSLRDASLIRVLKQGAEVPAHVDVATPWRSISDPAQDAASIRVARVQFVHTFSTSYPGE